MQKFKRDDGNGKAKAKPQKVHSSRVIPNLLGGFTGTTRAAGGTGINGNKFEFQLWKNKRIYGEEWSQCQHQHRRKVDCAKSTHEPILEEKKQEF